MPEVTLCQAFMHLHSVLQGTKQTGKGGQICPHLSSQRDKMTRYPDFTYSYSVLQRTNQTGKGTNLLPYRAFPHLHSVFEGTGREQLVIRSRSLFLS